MFQTVVLPANRLRPMEITVRVFRNPSAAEYATLRDRPSRFLVNRRTGDLYLWDAFDARHADVFTHLYLDGDADEDYFSGHLWPAVERFPVGVEVHGAARRDQDDLGRNRNVRRILTDFRFMFAD